MHERDGKKAGGPQPTTPNGHSARAFSIFGCLLSHRCSRVCLVIVDLVVLFRKSFFWGWLVTKLKRETCLVSQFKHPGLHFKYVGRGRGGSLH